MENISVSYCLKLFQNYSYDYINLQCKSNCPYYTTGSAACQYGREGIYLEDDRDTYYAGSVVMGPPSYKSRPSSMVYVNQGDYSNPVVIGNGDPSKYMFYWVNLSLTTRICYLCCLTLTWIIQYITCTCFCDLDLNIRICYLCLTLT